MVGTYTSILRLLTTWELLGCNRSVSARTIPLPSIDGGDALLLPLHVSLSAAVGNLESAARPLAGGVLDLAHHRSMLKKILKSALSLVRRVEKQDEVRTVKVLQSKILYKLGVRR